MADISDLHNAAFVIDASTAERLHLTSNLSLEAFLTTLVSPTRSLARPPISQFYVGAVALGSSGRIFRGVNLEFPGLPLSNAVHAEQFLVANALRNGESELRFIAVSAAPCGHCRQFLQELKGATELRVLIADANAEMQDLAYFLPHRFGPHDFLQGEVSLLLEPVHNGLSVLHGECGKTLGNNYQENNSLDSSDTSSSAAASECNANGKTHSFLTFNLKRAALLAANRSHSPYSKSPSGIALLTHTGEIYSGSYIESVAFNPSLPPLQAALVDFVSRNGGSYTDIMQAALVEKLDAAVQFGATTKLALEKISPACVFHVYHAIQKDNSMDLVDGN